jgi:hypothetical protein
MENILDTSKYRLVRVYSKGKYIIPSRTVLLCSSNSLEYIQQERDKIVKKEGYTFNEEGVPIKRDEDWREADGDDYTQFLKIWEFPFVLVLN